MVRTRRSLWRILRRILLIIILLLLLVIGGLFTYQTVATAQDEAAYPAPGRFIEVRDYRWHVNISGAETTSPTVILDHASGSAGVQWAWVEADVAQFARVVNIDRPGQGYSDAPPQPLTAVQYAKDLHSVLERAGLKPPYLLVGHSMGNLTSRAFAAQFPDEIAGLVLVDPRDLDIVTFSQRIYEQTVDKNPSWMESIGLPLIARMGIIRLMLPYAEYLAQLPPTAAARARALTSATRQWQGYIPDALVGENAVELLKRGEQLNVPVIVLSADTPDEAFAAEPRRRFIALHQEMAQRLSRRGEHRMVANSNHYSIVTNQKSAQVITQAVRDIAKAGR